MLATGHILQYSPTKKRGTLHLGGKGHSALLTFGVEDCTKTVQDELQRGEIPDGPALKVQFNISLRHGGLVGTRIRLADKKPAGRHNRSKPSRRSSKRK
jgi:hypothetical protein